MMFSKRNAQSGSRPDKAKAGKAPSLEELLEARDYVGACTLCTLLKRQQQADVRLLEWLAYAHFHNGEHDKALAVYQELLRADDPDPLYHTYAAACLFYMGLTQEAEEAAMQGPRCPLATRILFHCAHRRGDEDALMTQHSHLSDGLEDKLSLAALHFNRGHFQEASGIYKSLLLEHRELLALNVYVALTYARLDYYDVSQEVLQGYLAAHPASPLAANLRACNAFRLSNGKAAEAELRALAEATHGAHAQHDLIRHNLVVFRGGEGAQQVLPGLGSLLPEARLNLIIHHLRRGDVDAAAELAGDLEPSTPQEHILKAVVAASLAQRGGPDAPAQRKAAIAAFSLVGSSASECDTILGRQAMASAFFLQRQYEDVLVFLDSIRSYFPSDDDFAWNHGLALAATGRYGDAAGVLRSIRSAAHRRDPLFVSWLARCLIMTGKAAAAWELYATSQEDGSVAAEDAVRLLQLIGNDCYRAGAFFFAAKAFDALEVLEGPGPECYEAKRGAAVGLLQRVIAGQEQVVELLQRSAAADGAGANAAQVAQIVRIMRTWGEANGIVV